MDSLGGLFSDYNDSRQHQSSIDAQFIANAAAKKAINASSEIEVLRTAIDRLILINRALWEIIAESRGLTDEYLIKKVKEIDLRDGVLDGKIRQPVRKCASCGKILPAGRENCLYCGTKNEGVDPFHTINTESRNDLAQGLM
jgi:rRNA maturation endonuclease Nob1